MQILSEDVTQIQGTFYYITWTHFYISFKGFRYFLELIVWNFFQAILRIVRYLWVGFMLVWLFVLAFICLHWICRDKDWFGQIYVV